MKQKPRLSFWQIWNMSFGFLGIQFGFALQNSNVSRIFETLGAKVDEIPILWIAAPVTGLIIQPIIGHMSDNTWGRLGRRRPYFLVGAILASLALLIMPNSPALWIAAGMLWIMDASINISMEPFRAFVGDMLPSEQRTSGFAMQSFFIGTGAVVASALPYIMTNWFGIANTAPAGQIPPSVQYSFYLGAFAFFGAVLWTVLRTKEYPPDELASFSTTETEAAAVTRMLDTDSAMASRFLTRGAIFLISGIILSAVLYFLEWNTELYIFSGGIAFYGVMQMLAGFMFRVGKQESGIAVVMYDLYRMPKTMAQLAVVQFFSWFALFAMWIYTTAAVTSHIYDMKISKNEFSQLKIEQTRLISQKDSLTAKFKYNILKDEITKLDRQFNKGKKEAAISVRLINQFVAEKKNKSLNNSQQYDNAFKINESLFIKFNKILKEYNTGADWVGICFSMYNGFAAIVAFLLIILARLTSRKVTHMIALIGGGIGLISIYFIKDPHMILISMVGVGLAWASILSMPYAILAGAVPANKMGTYMGIFNFFIVIPQILAASILGFFTRDLFGGEAIYALMLGGASMIVAALLVLLVKDEH